MSVKTNCIMCGKTCFLGENAIGANVGPDSFNDKRAICDDCSGVQRDQEGMTSDSEQQVFDLLDDTDEIDTSRLPIRSKRQGNGK